MSRLLSWLLTFVLIWSATCKRFTLKKDPLWPSPEQIQALSQSLLGKLTEESDPLYTTPHTYNMRTGPPKPSILVQPFGVQDIQNVLMFARKHVLRISVKSTGHHQDIRNTCDECLQIDMRSFNHKSINLSAETMTVGPGQPFADIHSFVIEKSEGRLVALSGAEPGVGPAGWVMGGGHGRLTRLYGLGVDALISLDIVLYNGTLITVSDTSNQDLFWALKGSGGSTYGIIVSLTFKLFKDPGPVSSYSGYYPTSDEVANAFQSWMESAPDYAGAYYITSISILGKPRVQLSAFCFGDFQNCQIILNGLSSIPGCSSILGSTCKPRLDYTSYSNFLLATINSRDSGGAYSLYLVSSAFNFSTAGQLEVVNRWMNSYNSVDWPDSTLYCSGNAILGGFSSQLDQSRNLTCVAPAMRKSKMAITCVVVWEYNGKNREDLVIKIDEWGNNVLKRVGMDGWVYWNEPQHNSVSDQEWQNRYWGGLETYKKLLQVKNKYDPENTFTCHHCVGWETLENVDPSSCPDNCRCSNQLEPNVCVR